MTEERAKLYADAIRATNTMVMHIICPPGTIALALATAVIVPIGALVLLLKLYG